jgi:hypothetical protein
VGVSHTRKLQCVGVSHTHAIQLKSRLYDELTSLDLNMQTKSQRNKNVIEWNKEVYCRKLKASEKMGRALAC